MVKKYRYFMRNRRIELYLTEEIYAKLLKVMAEYPEVKNRNQFMEGVILQLYEEHFQQSTGTFKEEEKVPVSVKEKVPVLLQEPVSLKSTGTFGQQVNTGIEKSTGTFDRWQRDPIKCPGCSSKNVSRTRDSYFCEDCGYTFREPGKEEIEEY